jgi:ribosomal protein S27E
MTIIGYCDGNGSVRCIECANDHPEEEWTDSEEITNEDRAAYEWTCGICGLLLVVSEGEA